MNRPTLIGSLILLLSVSPCLLRAQSSPPVWNNTSNYVAGDMVTDYGNVYRCIKPITTHYLDPSKTYTNWELNYVRSGTTLTIGTGQTFPSLKTAWTFIENATIAQGAYLHLAISTANGPYSESLGLGMNLDHPFGSSISIMGDNAENVDFTSVTDANAFTLDNSHAIGSISKMSFYGGSLGAPGMSVLNANTGAVFNNVSGLSVSNYNHCYYAEQLAQIQITGLISFGSGQQNYFWADQGGFISIFGNQTFSNASQGQVGICMQATAGGQINTGSLTISNFTTAVSVSTGGTVITPFSIIENSTVGVSCTKRGMVDSHYDTFTSNGTDIKVSQGGTVDITSGTYSSSTVGTNDGSYIYPV